MKQEELDMINRQKVGINFQTKTDYIDQNGWEVVKIILEPKKIARLCRHPYHGHRDGCKRGCKFHFYDEVIDKTQDVWAIYFSMNLNKLWDKIRKNNPHFTKRQVENMRYWNGRKNKYLRIMEQEFLKEHPGPWAKALNRGPNGTNYTFGISYNKTMNQTEAKLHWPPNAYPITVQFVGRPIRDDLDPTFILE